MGTIYRVGRIWYLDYQGPTGARIRRSAHTQFKGAARLALREAETRVAAGESPRPRRPLTAFLTAHLTAQRPTVATSTYDRYQDCLHALTSPGSPLTGLLLDAVTLASVSAYAQWRIAAGRHAGTAEKECRWLTGALTEAARRDLLPWETVAKLRDHLSPRRFPLLRGASRRRDRVVLPHEWQRLIEAAQPNQNLADALTVAFWTGLRQGNLLTLAEQQLDFTCEPAVMRFCAEDMKGRSSHILALPPIVKDILWRRWQGIPDRHLLWDFRPAWKRLQRRLADTIPGLRFHDLRRSYITYRLAAGIDPKTVQAEAAHQDSRMTMDCYGRAIRDPGIRAWARTHFRFPHDQGYDVFVTQSPEIDDVDRTEPDNNKQAKQRIT